MEPKDSDEDAELNKLIEELDKPITSEESDIPKKDDKNPFKDKKNDEYNEFEYSNDIDASDLDW